MKSIFDSKIGAIVAFIRAIRGSFCFLPLSPAEQKAEQLLFPLFPSVLGS